MLPEVGGTAPPWLYAVAVDERVRLLCPVARLALKQNLTASPRLVGEPGSGGVRPPLAGALQLQGIVCKNAFDLHRPELPPQLGL
jgi:hypothetical protein